MANCETGRPLVAHDARQQRPLHSTAVESIINSHLPSGHAPSDDHLLCASTSFIMTVGERLVLWFPSITAARLPTTLKAAFRFQSYDSSFPIYVLTPQLSYLPFPFIKLPFILFVLCLFLKNLPLSLFSPYSLILWRCTYPTPTASPA
jgi:hypothetical protein